MSTFGCLHQLLRRLSQRRKQKRPQGYFSNGLQLLPVIFWWEKYLFGYSSNNSCLLPQKPPRQNELASPRHKKMPFVAGTVNQFWCSKNLCSIIRLIPLDWFWFSLSVTVDKPEPFGPCQRTKYPSHDEAPPASAVWTSQRSAKVWLWSQEEPPKGLFSNFCHFAQDWKGAGTSRAVVGLTVWPAPGSAGRVRADELVSWVFHDIDAICWHSWRDEISHCRCRI